MAAKTDSTTTRPRQMGTTLVIAGPEGGLRRHALPESGEVVLGRGAGCTIRLEHEQVSRRHAELARQHDGRWVVRDLGSRNGVQCDGRTLDGPLGVLPGMRFTVGPYTLTLADAGFVAAESQPQEHEHLHTIAAYDDRKTSTVQTLSHTPRQFDPGILSKLHQLDQWLMDLPDPARRYHRLCEFVIHENAGAQYCAVLDPAGGDDGEVSVLRSVARGPQAGQAPYISRTLLDRVAGTGEPTLLSNTPAPDDDGGLMLSIAPEQVLLSAIACPLEETQGGPVFYATFHTQEVNPSWLDLMVLIADQYRHARAMLEVIENANQKAALDRDLARAREIQSGLLPADWEGGQLDIAYGFRPCHAVGGDYLDVVPMPDGRVLLAIADVTGKGLQAALIASSIHTMVHAVVQTGGDLPEVYRQLNNYLIHFAPTGSFASMVLAAIDPQTGRASVLNAGHPPIVCVDAAGNASALQHETGFLPLGIDEQDYESSKTQLEPGSSWFFYTDGLSELPLEDGGMLGVEGVADLTAKLAKPEARQTIDAWMQHLARENEGQGQADDQTLICLRRPR